MASDQYIFLVRPERSRRNSMRSFVPRVVTCSLIGMTVAALALVAPVAAHPVDLGASGGAPQGCSPDHVSVDCGCPWTGGGRSHATVGSPGRCCPQAGDEHGRGGDRWCCPTGNGFGTRDDSDGSPSCRCPVTTGGDPHAAMAPGAQCCEPAGNDDPRGGSSNDWGCPPPDLPETPLTVLLPIVGGGIAVGTVVVVRRRHSRAEAE